MGAAEISNVPEWKSIAGRVIANVGGVEVKGHTSDSQSGGVNAPEHKTERGYEWRTRSGAEAQEATIDGWVNPRELHALVQLRKRKVPFRFLSTIAALPKATLEDLEVTNEGSSGGVEVSIKVVEVQQAQTTSGSVRAVGVTGSKSSSAGAGAGGGGNSSGAPARTGTTGRGRGGGGFAV